MTNQERIEEMAKLICRRQKNVTIVGSITVMQKILQKSFIIQDIGKQMKFARK